MTEAPPTQVSLPQIVRLTLPAQHFVVLMQALQEFGPHKLVHPVIDGLEKQALAQDQRRVPESSPEPAPLAETAPKPDSPDVLRQSPKFAKK